MNFRHFLQIPASSTARIAATAIAVTIATVALPIASASAGGGHHRHHRGNTGDIVLGGIIGLTIGAIAEGSNHRRSHRVHRRSYRPYSRPPVRIYDDYNPNFIEYDREPRSYGAREPRPFRPYASRERRPTRYRETREQRPRQSYRKRERAPIQRNTLRDFDAPKVITYNETASIEPWSAGWKDYCRTKYRSFNPKSGTFLGYDGDRHFCVAK
ncbi:MAG: BA14K family protein [Rhizobiaceae bacterium]